jgi:hypothetical protein
MVNCIDIFSRLLIATFTFVVPIIINLLSTFADGEKRRKELAHQTEEQISKAAAEELQTNPQNIRRTIDQTSQQYKEIDRSTNAELALLNPIVQFWNIFTFLSLSFSALILDYLIRKNTFNLYNHKASCFCLIIAAFTYVIALFFIIRILYTISKTRKIIASN